jgi:5-methylcytosine-specific restriction protein B
MESKKPIPLHHEEKSLRTPSGAAVPQALAFPENLFVIGTVNVDETTYMFSPKVLDRANVLEFRIGTEQTKDFLSQNAKHVTPTTPAAGVPLAFLEVSRRARGLAEPALASPTEAELAECRQSLQGFFDLLYSARLEFGFRTISEITRYLHVDFEFAADKSEWRWQDCLDALVLQKILPKLHGSRRRLETILITLATYCEERDFDAAKKPLLRDVELNSYPPANQPNNVAFPLSRTKLVEMIEAVRRDQFVSFIQ